MVVSVTKGPYKNVSFIENGKEVGKASFEEGTDRPKKVWTRVGPLGETPKHVTDAYPLSDQQNKGGGRVRSDERRVRGEEPGH